MSALNRVNAKNRGVTAIMDGLSERSTKACLLLGNDPNFSEFLRRDPPQANEKLMFKRGDTVVTTGKGIYKAGYICKVTLAYLTPQGFAKYFAGGLQNKQGDLKAYKKPVKK